MKEYRKIPSLKFLYEINSEGEIRNIKSKHILKPFLSNGYYRICIGSSANKDNKKHFVHQLVAECWLGPKPSEGYEIDHIDRNKLNNDYHNLRWVTKSENQLNRDFSNINPDPYNEKLKEYQKSDKCISHMKDISAIVSEKNKKKLEISSGSFSMTFDCAKDAAKWISSNQGGSVHTISNALGKVARGERAMAYGYYIRYIR